MNTADDRLFWLQPGLAYCLADLQSMGIPEVDIRVATRAGRLIEAAPEVWHVRAERLVSFMPNPVAIRPSWRDVGLAYARQQGWQCRNGVSAMENAFGFSTQVPARILLACNGLAEDAPGLFVGEALVFEGAPGWLFDLPPFLSDLAQAIRKIAPDRLNKAAINAISGRMTEQGRDMLLAEADKIDVMPPRLARFARKLLERQKQPLMAGLPSKTMENDTP